MMKYYFLATALPVLQIGMPPEISWEEFQNLLADNLILSDYKKAETMRRFYDIQNIRAFWKGVEIDYHGNLDAVELEDALVAREGLPGYVYDYIDQNDSFELRISHFAALLNSYFMVESREADGFFKKYLRFEREWRLVLTGFRAKQLNRNLGIELQFEDPADDLVAQILAQKDSKTYIPPDRYQVLTPLFEEYVNDPLGLFQALCEYRFSRIDEMLEVDLFSIDYVLGYMAKLITVEKWMELDKQKGEEALNKILPSNM